MSLDIDHLRNWLGREMIEEDVATADPARRLAATLDRDDRLPALGEDLPPLSHWLYFLPHYKQSDLKSDGHGKLGDFLPPISLPRRMWAGSRLSFHAALRVGAAIRKRTKIVQLESKQGRSGKLIFLTLEDEISDDRGLLVSEQRDIVYREDAKEATPRTAPFERGFAPQGEALPAVQWSRAVDPDPALLFRYSALTFNAHRIHYDLAYARDVEGYANLVVHGPLTATLIVDLLRRNAPEKAIRTFSFRGLKPLFSGAGFSVCAGGWKSGGAIELWTQNTAGERTTVAQIIAD